MMHAVETPTRADLNVSDVRLSVQRSGAGAPAVFLHGAGGAADWLPFYDALASRYALHVPDHPGFGESDDPDWIRTVNDVAMLYLEAFEEAGLHEVHVIGHSLGGWIAAEMAIRDRTRIKTLTLIAPAGVRVKGVPIADNFMWTPEETAHNLFFDQSYADRQLAFEPDEAAMDIIVRNRFAAAKLAWQPRWYDPNLPKWLHRARVPAHVLWGDCDRLLPHAYLASWGTLLPNARQTTIERAGHLPHIEAAAAVAALTLDFLKENDG